MKEGPNIANIATLIGDPARANMLTALMSGKALTVTELANEAGITKQTASAHLTKLHESKLISPRKQGRHKYFALDNNEVAHVLEGIMGLAANAGHLRTRPGPKDEKLRNARVCYNHLAGDMGTQMFDSMIQKKHLIIKEKKLMLTDAGSKFAMKLDIDLDTLRKNRSPVCLECLDWSERKSHLAGSLGRAFLKRFEELKWIKRDKNTRVITFSKDGLKKFKKLFPLD